MSVAEFKAQARKLSLKQLRELAGYFRGLAVGKNPGRRARTKRVLKTNRPIPLTDPLLNLDKFAVAGPGGKLTNQEIDRILYGRK